MVDSLTVTCPCCEARLEVDPNTGTIRRAVPREKAAPSTDLTESVRQLREAEAGREELFAKSLEAEKARAAGREDRFAELLRRARQGEPEG